MVLWEGDTFIPLIELCQGNKAELYTDKSGSITTIDKDCKVGVNNQFEVFDRIKMLANFEHTVKEIKLSYENGDFKAVSFFTPSSSYDKDQFKK